MADVFSVTGTYDRSSYIKGQVITVTIAGNDVSTVTTTGQIGPVAIPLVAANGATSVLNMPQTTVSIVTATPQSVTIDTTRPIVDTSPTPRTWTVAANKLSLTATA